AGGAVAWSRGGAYRDQLGGGAQPERTPGRGEGPGGRRGATDPGAGAPAAHPGDQLLGCPTCRAARPGRRRTFFEDQAGDGLPPRPRSRTAAGAAGGGTGGRRVATPTTTGGGGGRVGDTAGAGGPADRQTGPTGGDLRSPDRGGGA